MEEKYLKGGLSRRRLKLDRKKKWGRDVGVCKGRNLFPRGETRGGRFLFRERRGGGRAER